MTPLFRPEALEGQRQSWLGGVQLIRPLPLNWLTAFVVGVAVMLGAYLFLGEYTQSVRVGGLLVLAREPIALRPPSNAVVLERRVADGQAVFNGDILFVLAPPAGPSGAATAAPMLVRAPLDGTVEGPLAEVGQTVLPATSLVRLKPLQPQWQAQLLAPPTVLAHLHRLQPVRLRWPAFPSSAFSAPDGQVIHFSRTPMAAADREAWPAPDRPGAPPGPLYRITIALDAQSIGAAGGDPLPLAEGMRVEADLPLERRRLIDWLFSPATPSTARP